MEYGFASPCVLTTSFPKKVPISDILCTITLGFPSSVFASGALKTIVSPTLSIKRIILNNDNITYVYLWNHTPTYYYVKGIERSKKCVYGK